MSNKQTFLTRVIASCLLVAGGVLMTVSGYQSINAQIAEPFTEKGAVLQTTLEMDEASKEGMIIPALHAAAPVPSPAMPLLIGALLILVGLYVHAFLVIKKGGKGKGRWFEIHWFKIYRK